MEIVTRNQDFFCEISNIFAKRNEAKNAKTKRKYFAKLIEAKFREKGEMGKNAKFSRNDYSFSLQTLGNRR